MKLSKRHGAVSLMEYRDQGFLPEAMFNYLALLGWSPGDDKEIMSCNEIIERFMLDRVNASNAVFDIEKLEWMNQQYIMVMDRDELITRSMPFLTKEKIYTNDLNQNKVKLRSIIDLMAPRLKVLADISKVRFFFSDEFQYDDKLMQKHCTKKTLDIMADYLTVFRKIEPFDIKTLDERLRTFADKNTIKAREIIHPLRAYVTGQEGGPGLFETMAVLGRDTCIRRIEKILKQSGHNV